MRKLNNIERNIEKCRIAYKRGLSLTCALILSHIYTLETFAASTMQNSGNPGINTAAYAGLNNFGTISENMTNSSSALPGLVSAFCYLCGALLACMAVVKLKDHVENPKQVPLKTSAIMMTVGGAFLALPIVYESMFVSIGDTNNAPLGATLSSVNFIVGN